MWKERLDTGKEDRRQHGGTTKHGKEAIDSVGEARHRRQHLGSRRHGRRGYRRCGKKN